MELARRTSSVGGTGVARLAKARLAVLEEENAALRKELSRRAVCVLQENTRCDAPTTEPGCLTKDDGGKSERLSALERKIEELGPSLMRALEERL